MNETLRQMLLVLTLRCEEAEKIRLRAQYGETSWLERLAEVLHRAICGPCKRAAKLNRQMHDVLHGFAEREQVDEV